MLRYLLLWTGIASSFVETAAAGHLGYESYTDWIGWARLRLGDQAGLASSFDRSGGNYDFSHYEYPEGLIRDPVVATIKTIQGPGMIHRFWMPHLTAKQGFVVRMYFDGEETPRIDTTSDLLLAQGYAYFVAPFVDTCAGGQVCYEPIPFGESLLIETVNHTLPETGWSAHRHYYHYTYTTYPPETVLTSFSGTLSPEQQAARDLAAGVLGNVGQHPDGNDPEAVLVATPLTTIPPAETCSILSVQGPGIVRRLNLEMLSAGNDELDDLYLVVSYDAEPTPAIDVPVAQFFGAGHQRAPYRSLPLGTDSPDGFYAYWPMPFRQSISIKLDNHSAMPITLDGARVEYQAGPVATDLCYLRVQAHTNIKAAGQIFHPILSTAGRGHYVGNLLFIEQSNYSFSMLEGDEVITVDGVVLHNGTGLEDAYNGGYYYNWSGVQYDEPEGPKPQSAHRPLSGILYVHREEGVQAARADQYRWYIADRVPFQESIEVNIENRYSVTGTIWTSVAFWYQQPPLKGDLDDDGDLDGDDLSLFVDVLLDPAAYPDHCWAADMNGDEAVDGQDIPGLVIAYMNL